MSILPTTARSISLIHLSLCFQVKVSSPCKFNKAAWIKTITQFVDKGYSLSDSGPLTVWGCMTPDLFLGHVTRLLHCSRSSSVVQERGEDTWREYIYTKHYILRPYVSHNQVLSCSGTEPGKGIQWDRLTQRKQGREKGRRRTHLFIVISWLKYCENRKH